MKRANLAPASLFAIFLLACGGSDGTSGSTPAAAIDKYAGTWSSCVVVDGKAEENTFSVTRSGDTKGVFASRQSSYAFAECTGTPISSKGSLGTFDLTGTKTIGSETVDKAAVTESTRTPYLQVFLVREGAKPTLTFGRIDGELDAEGYPVALDNSSLARQ
jgi:hypothetical protein